MNDLKKNIPNILISLVLIGLLVTVVDLRATFEAMRNANKAFLLMAMALGFIWLLVRTVVWRTLLREEVNQKTTFLTLMEGYLLNNTLPFRMGEIGRAFFLSQKSPLNFLQVLSTIMIERIGDLGFSALVLLGALPFLGSFQMGYQVGVVALVAIILFFGVLYWFAGDPFVLINIVKKLFSKVPKAADLFEKAALKIVPGLAVLRNKKAFFRFVLWMTLNWLVAIVQYTLLIKAFFPNATVIWGMFTLGAAAFGGAIPSLPGGVGTLEGAMTAAIALFTKDPSGALAIPLTLRLINYFYSGVFGFYALSKEQTTISGVYQQLKAKLESLRD